MKPEELLFAPTHEWAHISDDTATIGISKNAVEALTDLVYMDLPAAGTAVKSGESFGEVESVKALQSRRWRNRRSQHVASRQSRSTQL